MTTMTSEPTMALLSIVQRGNGKRWIAELGRYRIRCHFRFVGQGTVSSEMLTFLGLGNRDKSLIFSLGAASAVRALAADLENKADKRLPAVGGIMMLFSLEAVSNLIAMMTTRLATDGEQKGNIPMKHTEQTYSLILAAVNQGFTDSVMQTARKAGATGGTIVRARMADIDVVGQFLGAEQHSEKEVLAIMAPVGVRDAILEAVNAEFGVRSPAQGVLCALPVEKAFKI